MNYEASCITAQATTGLSIIKEYFHKDKHLNFVYNAMGADWLSSFFPIFIIFWYILVIVIYLSMVLKSHCTKATLLSLAPHGNEAAKVLSQGSKIPCLRCSSNRLLPLDQLFLIPHLTHYCMNFEPLLLELWAPFVQFFCFNWKDTIHQLIPTPGL